MTRITRIKADNNLYIQIVYNLRKSWWQLAAGGGIAKARTRTESAVTHRI